jgi:hypothetical protein
MEDKKKDNLSKGLNIISQFLEAIVSHADQKVMELKKKTLKLVVLYGLFLTSVIFLLIGFTKYLAFKMRYHEGIMFMVVGLIVMFGVLIQSFMSKD